MIISKKADERLLTPWMFLVWVIIGLGVISGIVIFYSPINIKQAHAEILANKIDSCLIINGQLIEIKDSSFDVVKYCNFNDNLFLQPNLLYLSIRIFDKTNTRFLELTQGDPDIIKQCELQNGIKAEKFANCFTKKEAITYLLNGQIVNGYIEITTGNNLLEGSA